MTFDDDGVRVNGRFYSVKALGLEWPPPETLYLMSNGAGVACGIGDGAVPYRRVSISALTDEQRAEMTHVCRGAEYEPELRSAS